MQQTFESEHRLDDHGRPAGGESRALGIEVFWQNGPLGNHGPDRQEPNGGFVETVIAIALDRLEFYQEHFPCRENDIAIGALDHALAALNARTQRRTEQGVEGTHEGT